MEWTYEKLKMWRRKNRGYNAAYMQERRKHYRRLYLKGLILYSDIPKSYRYFVPSK